MQVSGKTIVVTRPEPENTNSCAFFESLGAHPISLPMMAIRPITDPQKRASIQSKIFDIDLYDFVIFVSKNAVREASEWLDRCWPMLPEAIQWIGIGQGTTKRLLEEGIPATTNAGQTSEDLLQWPLLSELQEKKVLIIKGEGGRTTLSDSLSQRGAKVNDLSLYERIPLNYSEKQLSQADTADLILITSGEGLENLQASLAKHAKVWCDKTIITPSERVAELAIHYGWTSVFQAAGADDNSILQAIDCLQDI
ncbi:uroporphyrinogen-III synthase [Marinomonas sp. 2405UD68-3]|uniref:uroporphyrinogen-III synthase n=1 Tax=Marinomonas sp. 2405UD68-3 TaxID=3391835 RepID=UPI0039C938AF